ncbi:MAG: type II secretion system F family protein [Deltaproteobacteria bacterium]|nr:type II secretion system F family protein [Deltaproteobacteria bacterium]
MPGYVCTALNAEGLRVREFVTAPDKDTVAERLRARGFVILEIADDDSGRAAAGAKGGILARLGMVRTRDLILLFRMFSSLIESNVTISEAMEILHEQCENRKLKWVLADIRQRIEGGMPLSDSMAVHPKVFPETITNMIRAGELGGILDTVLVRISDYLEGRAALRAKMILSMIYPSVVVVVAIVVVVFLVTFVIPKFAVLLGGRKLPANTQLLLDLAAFLTTNAVAILAGVFGSVAALVLVLVIPESRLVVDRYKIYLPVIGSVFRYGVIVQFAKTFAALLESGITLVEALRATGATISNLAVKKHIDRMNDKVLAGEPLSAAFRDDRFFTPMVGAMVKIGEHSGLMDQAMTTVGELHEKVLADKIARMSAMIEPVLIVVLGGIVGYVAWGLVAGMLALYSA